MRSRISFHLSPNTHSFSFISQFSELSKDLYRNHLRLEIYSVDYIVAVQHYPHVFSDQANLAQKSNGNKYVQMCVYVFIKVDIHANRWKRGIIRKGWKDQEPDVKYFSFFLGKMAIICYLNVGLIFFPGIDACGSI